MKFEIVSARAEQEISLPTRKTANSAGYDFIVAEDTIIPAYERLSQKMIKGFYVSEIQSPVSLQEAAALTKYTGAKPTLVPTGIKCELETDHYLELSVRSSCPLKYWLILSNGVCIIDADYYNNPSNEGEIFFQLINLAPFDIILKKGDIIGQGIIKRYEKVEDDNATGERQGGFGSTTTQQLN